MTNDILEQLANYAHEAWSGWMKYMFEKSIPYIPEKIQAEEGALIIPKWAVDKWTYQMNTPYSELPEDMQESDRHEADKILKIYVDATVENAGILSAEIADKLTAQEQAFFIAGFQECIKYLNTKLVTSKKP